MVHDIEAMIGHKIRAAEQHPVTWQKDHVWQNIKWESRTKGIPVLYYAAATFLLATCLLAYFLWKTENENAYQRIKTLETAINDHWKSHPANPAAGLTIQTDCKTPVQRETLTAHTGMRPWRKSIPHELSPMPIAIGMVVPSLSDKMPEISAVLKSEAVHVAVKEPERDQVNDNPTINAIIGVIPAAYENTSVAKVRKLKFRLLPVNDTPMDGRSAENYTTVITARIN